MPSISPPSMSTVDNVDVPVAVKSPLKVAPDAANVVNAPEDADVVLIAVPSISPPSMSTVDKVDVPVAVKSPLKVVAPMQLML